MLPEGLSRSDVAVTLAFHSSGAVKIAFLKKSGEKLQEITVDWRWHPETEKKKIGHGFDENSYPHYLIVSKNGINEVIEVKRREPFFYITDDPVLRAGIGASGS
jgi:hypothetical protein